MRWGDVLELITITTAQNAVGDDIETKTYAQVYTNKKSVRQSEFYQAMQNKLKPEIILEVRTVDYSNQQTLRYAGTEYTIIRAYPAKNEVTELTCQGLV